MTKPNICIFPLEPLDSRYTAQWYDEIPRLLNLANNDRFNIINIDGTQSKKSVTEGAFLNFSDTNRWKSSQLINFLDLFDQSIITTNDRFLFTDFWNPCLLQIKYMKDLLDQNWEIHAISHAGAFDPTDILGYKMTKPWCLDAEKAMYYACDVMYYGTDFQRNMFVNNMAIPLEQQYRSIRSGQPHDQLISLLETMKNPQKCVEIIWPHRYNADKQPAIAEDLASEYQVFFTQKHNLNKKQYYNALADSKIIFSCSLHENLGISIMEAVLLGCIPVLPNRCSYQEMYNPEFLYPSEWTENLEAYLNHRDDLTDFIDERLENLDQFQELLAKQVDVLKEKYLTAKIMIDRLTK